MDFLNEVADVKSTSMDKIYDLHTQLLANCMEIDKITGNIEKYEAESDLNQLESLYRNEFVLYMDHIGLYEDLIKYIEKEPRTFDNKFELAKIKREAQKMLRVTVVEM